MSQVRQIQRIKRMSIEASSVKQGIFMKKKKKPLQRELSDTVKATRTGFFVFLWAVRACGIVLWLR